MRIERECVRACMPEPLMIVFIPRNWLHLSIRKAAAAAEAPLSLRRTAALRSIGRWRFVSH